jgi:hypothetical protein
MSGTPWRLAVALAACLPLVDAPGQNPVQLRYELGKRLQRLERALEAKRDDKAAWARARPHLQQALGSFFGMSMENAERAIDEALAAVTDAPHENEPLIDGRLSLSSMGRLEQAVVRAGARPVALSAGRAYPVDTEGLSDVRGYSDSHLIVFAANAWCDIGEPKTNWGSSGMKFRFPSLQVLVDKLTPGDYRIAFRSDFTAMDETGKPVWTRREVADSPRRMDYGFSVIEDLDQKLRRLSQRGTRNGSPVETQIAFLESTIEALVAGRPVETDVPANRLLDRALELAELDETAAGDPASILPDASRGGDHWLMMTAAQTKLRARLVLPERLAQDAVLVMALHGMGGSEHMFVDCLGNGLAGRLARRRGWVLLSPRATATAPVLADAAAHRNPEPFRGKPIHVFTGSADFARGQCARLTAHLTEAGAVSELHSEEDIEHLTVVQWWLPEVFRFFDEQAK